MKIVILDGYTENPGDLSWEGFEALGEVTVYDRTPSEKIVERIGDADAVIVNKVPVSAETLAACPSIKYIGVLATGYNVVDVEEAKNAEFRYAIFQRMEQQRLHRWYLPCCWRSAIM